jgi:hypothetical protein
MGAILVGLRDVECLVCLDDIGICLVKQQKTKLGR